LGIAVIHARIPQAKGRVERTNQTLQDHPVKKIRLPNIDSREAANAFSPTFIEAFNQRFAGPPRDDASTFRPWIHTPEVLDTALARREERVLSKALTFSSAGTNIASTSTARGRLCAASMRSLPPLDKYPSISFRGFAHRGDGLSPWGHPSAQSATCPSSWSHTLCSSFASICRTTGWRSSTELEGHG